MRGDDSEGDYVKWFSEIKKSDSSLVGELGAGYGEMHRAKVPIPPGFVISVEGCEFFLKASGLANRIGALLSQCNFSDDREVGLTSQEIGEQILHAKIPQTLQDAITESYEILDTSDSNSKDSGVHALIEPSIKTPFVTLRGSPIISKDQKEASRYLKCNLRGSSSVLKAFKECVASYFSPEALYQMQGNMTFSQSVVVHASPQSNKSGMVYSRHPTKKESTMVRAVWGISDSIHEQQEDRYIFSGSLDEMTLRNTSIANKLHAYTFDDSGNVQTISVPSEKRKEQVLNSYESRRVAQYAKEIESILGEPCIVEFAIGNDIVITNARTVDVPLLDMDEEEESLGSEKINTQDQINSLEQISQIEQTSSTNDVPRSISSSSSPASPLTIESATSDDSLAQQAFATLENDIGQIEPLSPTIVPELAPRIEVVSGEDPQRNPSLPGPSMDGIFEALEKEVVSSIIPLHKDSLPNFTLLDELSSIQTPEKDSVNLRGAFRRLDAYAKRSSWGHDYDVAKTAFSGLDDATVNEYVDIEDIILEYLKDVK